MAIFISYSRGDSDFVDRLAQNLVMRRHHIWIDRWELNIGDSLISKIQRALTDSDAILIILSKSSVESEWCKKELNAGLIRELEEKRVLVLPCVIDDCRIPLFLREKLYADFRNDPDKALKQVDDALLRITNPQQGRLESPAFHTDWSYDWGIGPKSGLWYFEWTFVDHSASIEYCILTECRIACNAAASNAFHRLDENGRLAYIRKTFSKLTDQAKEIQLKIRLGDAFRKIGFSEIVMGSKEEAWFAEVSSRRMGIDNGKDTLVHIDQLFERTLVQMTAKVTKPA
jgi:hypothetical protein